MTNKKSTSREKKKRAQQILDAAEELLGEKGYDGMSARDIAQRAGVNKALVFYYWGSKAELFERILERYYTRHREALSSGLGGQGTLAQRIHRMMDDYLDFIEANRLYPRLVQQQICGGGPHLDLVRRHLSTFFEWTVSALAEISPAQGPLAPRHFYLSLSGMVVSYFTYTQVLGETWGDHDPLDPESLAERRQHIHWMVDAMLDRLTNNSNNKTNILEEEGDHE